VTLLTCHILSFPLTLYQIATCHTGASNGRGPRCANWLQDYINDVSKFGRKTAVQVRILKGGIKGWVREFEGSMMDGFEEKYWEQFKDQGKAEQK
jgi:hypothetical protein